MPGLPLLSDLASRYPLRHAPASGPHVSLVSGQLYVSERVQEAIGAGGRRATAAAPQPGAQPAVPLPQAAALMQPYYGAALPYRSAASAASSRRSIDLSSPLASSRAEQLPPGHPLAAAASASATTTSVAVAAAAAATAAYPPAATGYLAQRRAEREQRAMLAAASASAAAQLRGRTASEELGPAAVRTGGSGVWAWGPNSGSGGLDSPNAVGLSQLNQGALLAVTARQGGGGSLGRGDGGKREGIERWLAAHPGAPPPEAAGGSGMGQLPSRDGSVDEASVPLHAYGAAYGGRAYARGGVPGALAATTAAPRIGSPLRGASRAALSPERDRPSGAGKGGWA
ncbi:hypothetical protein GPECTOR_12g480 [Gonium pectorale]|uniref:Uncharacterized protein n=1 Tax=Gonium pectorale TaxID=33097 RepID=A0A150GNW8_GONPE|nr:hypothetical protein GPECTOR_12g480 [Gonium pectorale]|eukprot:KXZ51517.1 hypothetical protein GPECTOR_12g480 [Gonium pectorale]